MEYALCFIGYNTTAEILIIEISQSEYILFKNGTIPLKLCYLTPSEVNGRIAMYRALLIAVVSFR